MSTYAVNTIRSAGEIESILEASLQSLEVSLEEVKNIDRRRVRREKKDIERGPHAQGDRAPGGHPRLLRRPIERPGMTSAKGPVFERAILPWLAVLFPHVRRSGKGFAGADYLHTGPFSIEAKNRKEMKLAAWVKQAQLDAEASGAKYPVVVHKRRFFGPQGAYVTMTLEDWVALVADLKGIELPEDLYPVSEKSGPEWA